jgi:26S proteasome regulatory subunit N2
MISRAIDRYSAIQKHNYTATEGDKILIEANMTNLINNIFEESFNDKNDHKIIAGLAVEARRLDIIQRVIDSSSNLSDILGHLFLISQTHV